MTTSKTRLPPLSKKKAFTLIELIFVMVLLGLLAGLVVPKMSNMTGLSMKKNVTKMAGFLQRAHQMAVLQGQDFRIVLDMDEKSFWIEAQVPPQTKPLLPDEIKVDNVLSEFKDEAETYNDDEEIEKRKAQRFTKLKDKGIEPVRLPYPLFIDSVYFATRGERSKEGIIYIPISKTGYHPTVIIYTGFKDEIKYSLIFPSLSSKVKIEKGEVDPKEVKW